MRRTVKCCVLCYIDHDRKTYNPGLIITDPATEDEVCKITSEMIEQGRRISIFTSPAVDNVRQLPPLEEPYGKGIKGYARDTWLI